jgi:hypothetical protein
MAVALEGGGAFLGESQRIGVGREVMEAGTEQTIEEDIAISPVGLVVAGHEFGQDQFALQAGASRRSGGQAGVIRLASAGGDEGVAALVEGFAEEEFELSQFVAAAAEAHEVVAFYVDAGRVCLCGEETLEPFETLDRGGAFQELLARETFELREDVHDLQLGYAT